MSAIFGNIDGATGREPSAEDLERQERQSFDQFNREGESNGDDDGARPARHDDDDDDTGRPSKPRLRVGNPDEEDAEEIALRAEKRMDKKAKGFTGDMNDRDLQYGTFTEDSGEAPIGTRDRDGVNKPEPAADELQQQPSDRHKLRVNHQDLELTTEELYAAAQKTLAGDNYLEQGKRFLEEAKEIANQIKAGVRPAETAEERAAAEAGLNQEQVDARRQFLDAITYGEPEQQEAAIQQFEQDIIAKTTRQTMETIERTKAAELYNQDVQFADRAISELYPEFGQKDSLARGLTSKAAQLGAEVMANLVENLPPDQRQAFIAANLGPDQIRARASSFPAVNELMREFHASGHGKVNNLPPMSAVLGYAAKAVADELGIPARQTQQQPRSASEPRQQTSGRPEPSGRVQLSPERMARKDSISSQPQRSSASAGRQPPAGPVSQDRFHQEYLDEAREVRGIPIRRR